MIQGSDDWHEARKGVITGSKLKDIVVKRGTGRKMGSYELIAERMGIADLSDDMSSSRERGTGLEEEARQKFAEFSGKDIEVVGFVVRDDEPRIGYSPDGLIKVGKKYREGIEIKCLSAANHIKAVIEDKVPNEYLEQVYQAFIVNEDLEKLHFVFYDPRIAAKPLHVIEILRADVQEQVEFNLEYQRTELAWIEETLMKLTF